MSQQAVVMAKIKTVWPDDCRGSGWRLSPPEDTAALPGSVASARHWEWPDERGHESKQQPPCAHNSNHITGPWAICLCTLFNWIEPGMRLADIPSSDWAALKKARRGIKAIWDSCFLGTVWYRILKVSYSLQFHLTDCIAVTRIAQSANLYCLIWNNWGFYWHVGRLLFKDKLIKQDRFALSKPCSDKHLPDWIYWSMHYLLLTRIGGHLPSPCPQTRPPELLASI